MDDYLQFDGTDYAHPAYWRGHDAACLSLCQIINQILDGKDNGHGVANEPWESTRRRLLKLMTTYFWETERGCGEFLATTDDEARKRKPAGCLILYKESDTPDGMPFIILDSV